MNMTPEYLPMPDGYAERVQALVDAGHSPTEAHWMAACEASGAVARTENDSPDLYWHGNTSDAGRAVWERIAEHEGRRFYFQQTTDSLVGHLAHGRHNALINARFGIERQERLTKFINDHGLWKAWVAQNRMQPDPTPEGTP